MSQETRQLLSAIVSRYATTDEERRVELDANAELSGSEIEQDKATAVARERADADRQADAFGRGLQLAWGRFQHGGTEITLDDRKPDENAMASALIDYLVRFDLATSHSRKVDDQHYVYVIGVDWDRLRDLAAANGQQLPDMLGSGTEQSNR